MIQPIRYVNLGGGFGIPYFEKDERVDPEGIGENLEGLLSEKIRPSSRSSGCRRAWSLHSRRMRCLPRARR